MLRLTSYAFFVTLSKTTVSRELITGNCDYNSMGTKKLDPGWKEKQPRACL